MRCWQSRWSPRRPRDYISTFGSSTVYPFATVVAEQFGKITRFKTPKIESSAREGSDNDREILQRAVSLHR